jgi:hypothetical protein
MTARGMTSVPIFFLACYYSREDREGENGSRKQKDGRLLREKRNENRQHSVKVTPDTTQGYDSEPAKNDQMPMQTLGRVEKRKRRSIRPIPQHKRRLSRQLSRGIGINFPFISLTRPIIKEWHP